MFLTLNSASGLIRPEGITLVGELNRSIKVKERDRTVSLTCRINDAYVNGGLMSAFL